MYEDSRSRDFMPYIAGSTTLQSILSLIETKAGYPAKLNGNGYSARCPAHDDHDPSLSISEGQDGRTLVKCHAGCTFEEICASLKVEPKDLFLQETKSYSSTSTEKPKMIAKYPYKNKEGKLVCWKERYEPGFYGKDKSFVWKHYGSDGKIINDRKGCAKTLYHLPEVCTGIAKGKTICLVEGEKDADTLLIGGLIATTASESTEWNDEYTEMLKDANVALFYDYDAAGFKRRDLITKNLAGKVKELRIVDLPSLEYGSGKDVTDWLAIDGNTIEKLKELIAKTPEYTIPIASQKGGLCVLSLDQLLSLNLPPRIMLLKPFLPSQGLVMLVAKRGIGKTHVALGVAYAVASGSDFLCWSAPEPKKVLYVDGEMPAVSIQERLRIIENMSLKKVTPGFLQILTPDVQEENMPDLSTQEGRNKLESVVSDIELIIIDNISCLFRSGSENEADSWQEAQEWALRLRKAGKSVLFVHHTGKSGNQRGTSKREDILDAVIVLKNPDDYKREEGARFEVSFDKARHFAGEDARSFQAHLKTDGERYWWEVSCTSPEEQIKHVAEKTKAGCTIKQIGEEMGLTKSQVETLQKKAKEKELL